MSDVRDVIIIGGGVAAAGDAACGQEGLAPAALGEGRIPLALEQSLDDPFRFAVPNERQGRVEPGRQQRRLVTHR